MAGAIIAPIIGGGRVPSAAIVRAGVSAQAVAQLEGVIGLRPAIRVIFELRGPTIAMRAGGEATVTGVAPLLRGGGAGRGRAVSACGGRCTGNTGGGAFLLGISLLFPTERRGGGPSVKAIALVFRVLFSDFVRVKWDGAGMDTY